MYKKTDLHLHTIASDGSDTPKELLAKAKDKGIDVIAITDHDTLKGSLEAIRLQYNGVKVITGIEFSCCYHGELDFDCHILGYGFDPESADILAAIEHGREMRLKKLGARLDYLRERFGISFSDEDIEWLHSLNSVARPHLARLLVNCGYAVDMADAMDNYLKGGGFPDDRIDAKEVIDAIKAAGGISVYAHPIGGERERRLNYDEVLPRITALCALGLSGLECYYSRYSAKEESMLAELALTKKLFVSGGSDYHGENKTVKLGVLCSDDTDVTVDKITVLSELLSR